MASGLVEYIPSAASGEGTTELRNNNLTDFADIASSTFTYAQAVVATQMGIAPRQCADGNDPYSGSDFAKRTANWKLEASNDGSTWVNITPSPIPCAPQLDSSNTQTLLTWFAINTIGIAYTQYKITQVSTNPDDTNLSLAEWRLRGQFTTGVACRAVPPTFDPPAGRYRTAPSVSLVAVTGGSTPRYQLNGNSLVTFTTPIVVADGDSFTGQTTGSGLTASNISGAVYNVGGMFDNSSGYFYVDSEGNRLEGHAGNISYTGGYYYLTGMWMRSSPAGRNVFSPLGIARYRSRDLMVWEPRNFALAFAPLGGRFVERPGFIHCAATGKEVLWGHSSPDLAYTTNKALIATADTPDGTFTIIDSAKTIDGFTDFKDCSPFLDTDGSGYIIYNNAANIIVSKLASDFLDTLGLPHAVENSAAAREAPSMLRRRGLIFLFTSTGNFYDSTASYDVRWQTATSPTGTYGTQTTLFATDPVDDLDFNAQCSCVFPLIGWVDQYGEQAYGMRLDNWNGDGSGVYLFGSRHITVPLIFNAAGTSVSAPRVTGQWSPEDYFHRKAVRKFGQWPMRHSARF